MQAIIKAAANLPTGMPEGQPSGLFVDQSGRLHTGDQPLCGTRPVDLSADTTFTTSPRAVYVGTAGTIKVDCLDIDGTTTLTGKSILVTDFQTLPFASIKKIYSTANGTTATALWVGV